MNANSSTSLDFLERNPDMESGKTDQETGGEGESIGIRCELLTPVDETELPRLLGNTTHCLEELFDGHYLSIRKTGSELIGINRMGTIVAIPDAIAAAIPVAIEEGVGDAIVDCLIEGVVVGDVFHILDILEQDGSDCRHHKYSVRQFMLLMLFCYSPPALRLGELTSSPAEKQELFQSLRERGAQGVVFKNIEAPYGPGCPDSGDSPLFYKFVKNG